MAEEKIEKVENKKAAELNTVACKVKSRADHNVTFEYDGKTSILAPHQEVPIPDKSKLSGIDPTEIIVI